ncbi:MAG TPA: NADH-quinone oxidoreductase subunit J [Acidimicrobiales bacterium]|nr:NADH-quinone oxidoreductase subunit J [Acidimicrobiales bacterium]
MRLLASVTAVDAATFVVAGAAVVFGALGVVVSRNPVHSALLLVLTLFGVAVLFVSQDAQFLAAVQVIVYAGAIVVLFLFVIMLLGVDRRENLLAEPLKGQRPLAVALGLATLAEVLLLARVRWDTGARSVAGAASGPGSNVAKLARSLFTTYLLAFEVTGALLVIAVIGAVVLARRPPRPGRQASRTPLPRDAPRWPEAAGPGEPEPAEPAEPVGARRPGP